MKITFQLNERIHHFVSLEDFLKNRFIRDFKAKDKLLKQSEPILNY